MEKRFCLTIDESGVGGGKTKKRRAAETESAASLDESKRRGAWLNDVAKTR